MKKLVDDNLALLIPITAMFALVVGLWAGMLLAEGNAYYLCARDNRVVFDSALMLHPLEIECRTKDAGPP